MREAAFLFCALAIAVSAAGCDQEAEPYEPERPTTVSRPEKLMGTLVTIQVCEPDLEESVVNAAIEDALKRIEEIDKAMSAYNNESEISRVNRAAGKRRVYVGDDTYAVVEKAYEIAGETDGAFDITAGPLVELWKKAGGEAGIGEYPPGKNSIAEALELVGILDSEKFDFGKEDNGRKYIHLKKKGMQIDLGAIAKGYAVDEAIKVLRKHGIGNATVEAGGDVLAIGKQGFGDGWPVDVRHYAGLERYFDRWILKDMAVATSSDYERGYTLGGKHYSHIIDPRTGQAVTRLYSVSVFAQKCMLADALATAITVMGSEKGEELLRRLTQEKEEYKKSSFVVIHYTGGARANFAP